MDAVAGDLPDVGGLHQPHLHQLALQRDRARLGPAGDRHHVGQYHHADHPRPDVHTERPGGREEDRFDAGGRRRQRPDPGSGGPALQWDTGQLPGHGDTAVRGAQHHQYQQEDDLGRLPVRLGYRLDHHRAADSGRQGRGDERHLVQGREGRR